MWATNQAGRNARLARAGRTRERERKKNQFRASIARCIQWPTRYAGRRILSTGHGPCRAAEGKLNGRSSARFAKSWIALYNLCVKNQMPIFPAVHGILPGRSRICKTVSSRTILCLGALRVNPIVSSPFKIREPNVARVTAEKPAISSQTSITIPSKK